MEIARYLLEKGADPNFCGKKAWTAPLQGVQSSELTKLLLEHGATIVGAESQSYRSTLEEAAANGRAEVVKVLMDAGAKLNFESAVKLGWTGDVAIGEYNANLPSPRPIRTVHEVYRR